MSKDKDNLKNLEDKYEKGEEYRQERKMEKDIRRKNQRFSWMIARIIVVSLFMFLFGWGAGDIYWHSKKNPENEKLEQKLDKIRTEFKIHSDEEMSFRNVYIENFDSLFSIVESLNVQSQDTSVTVHKKLDDIHKKEREILEKL